MPEGGPGAPTRSPRALVARPHPRPRQGGAWTPWCTPGCPPSPIFTPRDETLEDRTLFRDLPSVPPPPPIQDRGCQETLSRHPAGGRIDLRELLHHHERFPDEP